MVDVGFVSGALVEGSLLSGTFATSCEDSAGSVSFSFSTFPSSDSAALSVSLAASSVSDSNTPCLSLTDS